jgi:signal transduction histidine kinase
VPVLIGVLVALVLVAAAFAAARARAKRLLALERVRARIAEDLHDDIGSSLSRISILSEVARRKIPDAEVAALLAEIAETSRALVGAMRDAVWSIDPAQDELRLVVARMRGFAADVLDGAGIAWTFETSGDPDARLEPETRRELFLVFKEAVTNVVRHSAATRVSLRFDVRAPGATLRVEDDGRGFDAAPARDLTSSLGSGRGLLNMQVRALRRGGRLSVTSGPGEGTRLVLVLPLEPPRRRV